MVNPLELLGYAGNLLDLPGSSVRDLLTGQNPFDQWMTPFSGDNRASGRDVLRPLLGANKETGMSGWLSDPTEGVKDVLGFGAEVALDPMNFVSGGAVLRAIKGGKAARQANAVNALREAGKYSYVNPRVLARQADEMVNPLDDMVRSTLDAKLSGPLPEDLIGGRTSFDVPENDMFDRLYMRRGARQLGKEKIDDAITVASIEARQPGSGAYRSLHNYLRGFGKPIVAEEVISPDFAAKLQHMGYEQVDSNWVYRPTVDDVAPAAASVAEQNPMKLLGYTPERETVFHGGRDWSASATPEHPYGVFDTSRLKTGEGNNAYGPGMYVADEAVTSGKYRNMAQERMNQEYFSSPEAMEKYFEPGSLVDGFGVLDRVEAFNRADSGLGWSVDVRSVDPSNPDVSVGGVRRHTVPPSPRKIAKKLGDNPYSAKLYQLDMPTGSKDRFMQWEARMADQPQNVQSAIASMPGMDMADRVTELEAQSLAINNQMREARVRAGARPSDWGFTNDELKNLREQYRKVNDEAERLTVEMRDRFGFRTGMLRDGNATGSMVADLLMGNTPSYATLAETAGLREAGVPGMKNLSNATPGSYNYAIWDQDLINQMRIRAIDGERVPINPTTLVQQVEQPTFRAAAGDSPLVSTMNPMRPQAVPSVLRPLAAGAAYNALARQNQYGGIL